MAALPDLITVSQFLEMQEDDGCRYELWHGEVVKMTLPSSGHMQMQRHLSRRLEPRLKGFEVFVELGYRPVPEFELRSADVGGVSRDRWDHTDPDDVLQGPPELVIEVKSPSNRKGKLKELATLCLGNGTWQFWVIDPKKKSVTVTRRDGATALYRLGDEIPLSEFGAAPLSVSEIFA